MGFKDKLKQFINVSDDDYIDGTEAEYEDDFDYSPAPQAPARHTQSARTERTTMFFSYTSAEDSATMIPEMDMA